MRVRFTNVGRGKLSWDYTSSAVSIISLEFELAREATRGGKLASREVDITFVATGLSALVVGDCAAITVGFHVSGSVEVVEL